MGYISANIQWRGFFAYVFIKFPQFPSLQSLGGKVFLNQSTKLAREGWLYEVIGTEREHRLGVQIRSRSEWQEDMNWGYIYYNRSLEEYGD